MNILEEVGIRITERKEIEGIALALYYPKRLKRKHLFDDFSRDLYKFKKFYDMALIGRLSKALANVIRATERTFDIATHPPPSRPRLYYPTARPRLYYPTAHLAKSVAVELDLDLLDCLRWEGGKGASQKKRVGQMKLKRLGEAVECTSDLTGLHVLLIDDILTTGLTASKCVEAMKRAGAVSVFVGVLGWAVSEDLGGFKRAF